MDRIIHGECGVGTVRRDADGRLFCTSCPAPHNGVTLDDTLEGTTVYDEAGDAWALTGEVCPACGAPSDYCLGHGAIGDPFGYGVLAQHDDDDHSGCHVAADCY